MKSQEKQQQQQPVDPIYREIPPDATARTRVHPAATAAALEELNRFASEIEEFVRESKLRTILEGVQGDIERAARGGGRMRLRRE